MQFSSKYRDQKITKIQNETVKFVEHVLMSSLDDVLEHNKQEDRKTNLIALDMADALSVSFSEIGNQKAHGDIMKKIMTIWVDEQFLAPNDNKKILLELINTLVVPSGE